MTFSLVLAIVWVLAANAAATTSSAETLWSRASVLIAGGIPLLGYITLQNGPWIGLLALAAGISVLRWPMRRHARNSRAEAASEA